MEIKITTDNFEAEVTQADVPVLVDFYADWCGPCKMMSPILDSIAEKYNGKIKIGKCDVDSNEGLAMRYQIMSIPNMIIFKNGEIAKQLVGARSQADLEAEIEEALK